MSYDIKVAIYDPLDGYNHISDIYNQYHSHLDSFDKGSFQRFIPRDTSNLDIIDLGSGDGRMFKFFKKNKTYTACDISPNMLNKHPKGPNIIKSIQNLDDDFNFGDDCFDLALCFFVLEYIQDLDHFFQEAYRILKPGGTLIVGHFYQRRAVIFKDGKKKFKIKRTNRRQDQIIEIGKQNIFDIYHHEIIENGIYVGGIFVCKKPNY